MFQIINKTLEIGLLDYKELGFIFKTIISKINSLNLLENYFINEYEEYDIEPSKVAAELLLDMKLNVDLPDILIRVREEIMKIMN